MTKATFHLTTLTLTTAVFSSHLLARAKILTEFEFEWSMALTLQKGCCKMVKVQIPCHDILCH